MTVELGFVNYIQYLHITMYMMFRITDILIVFTGIHFVSSVYTRSGSVKRDISQYILLNDYWKEQVSKADNGDIILTTKYRIPFKLQSSQTKPAELIQGGIVPIDCSDIHRYWPLAKNGVYKIYPAGGKGYIAYCDMKTDGGGWTVFQRRFDGSEGFYRNWDEYKSGFGKVSREHWLGNQILHEITVHGLYEMRVELTDFSNRSRFAKYNFFSIGNEADGYRINIGAYTGTAGDSFAFSNGMKFTTRDKDLDTSSKNCAKIVDGAWWFKNCFRAHLNGQYHNTSTTKAWDGLIWNAWHGHLYSLKGSIMMLRKHQSDK